MTTSNTSLLNLNQSEKELASIHGEKDYYWYLRSHAFQAAFMIPLGDIVDRIELPCLDVACGEGYLASHTKVPYVGFDGSPTAIEKANSNYCHLPNVEFYEGRIEDPYFLCPRRFGTIVFGGVLQVLIKESSRLALLEMYKRLFSPQYFVVYDLDILDHSPLEHQYKIEFCQTFKADLHTIEEIKTTRKIMVFKC